MHCDRSIAWHLLRGVLALTLILIAVVFGPAHPTVIPLLGICATVLLRGCPTCWLMGLCYRLRRNRDELETIKELKS